MKVRFHCTDYELREGKSKKTNEPYSMGVVQGVFDVVQEDGKIRKQIGEAVLPRGHSVPVAGLNYDAEFGLQIGFDKKVAGRLVSLTLVK